MERTKILINRNVLFKKHGQKVDISIKRTDISCANDVCFSKDSLCEERWKKIKHDLVFIKISSARDMEENSYLLLSLHTMINNNERVIAAIKMTCIRRDTSKWHLMWYWGKISSVSNAPVRFKVLTTYIHTLCAHIFEGSKPQYLTVSCSFILLSRPFYNTFVSGNTFKTISYLWLFKQGRVFVLFFFHCVRNNSMLRI